MNGREQRRRRWGAPRAMLLPGALLAALELQGSEARNCERRDRQLDGPNAPGWAAREERPARSDARAAGAAIFIAEVPWRVEGGEGAEATKMRREVSPSCLRGAPRLAMAAVERA